MGITLVVHTKILLQNFLHFRGEYLRLPSDNIPGIILAAVRSFNELMIDRYETNKQIKTPT